MEPAAGLRPDGALGSRPAAGAVARLWRWLTTAPAYPPDAADRRLVRIAGVELPQRATLALVIVSIVTLLDHSGTFLRWFWDGQGGDPALLRARAVGRAVAFGLGALVVIVLLFRDRPARYGVRLGDVRAGVVVGLAGAAVMTPIVLVVGLLPAFRDYYVAAASATPLDVVLTSAIELFPAELWFRGLLMFALLRAIGPLGIVVAQVPFAFAHLGKPEIETLSTLFGGFAYGWLDWRTGSVVWSAVTHTYVLSLAILVSGAMASG